MHFETELKKLIKEKYGSIRAFSKSINTPYSTIDNIFKRGIMGVSIQVVLRICSALNIDVEKIADDKLVFKKDENINSEIYQLYESLDSTDQAEIRGEIKHMLKAPKYNKPSISEDIAKDFKKIVESKINTKSE